MLERSVTVGAVELPGRGRRFGESPPESLEEVAGEAADVLEPELRDDLPVNLFGHSLGAHVAMETARRLENRGRIPDRVVVSGTQPSLPDDDKLRHEMSDEQLLEELEEIGGTPEEVMEQEELLELYLPVIRADFRLVETREMKPELELEAPILAVGGTSDPELDLSGLTEWEDYTTGDFRCEMFPGGHFYLTRDERQFVRWLETQLPTAQSNADGSRPG